MPRVEFECSETLMQLIEASRGGAGGIPLAEHIANLLAIGSGHVLEEVILQQRQALYQQMQLRTNNFGAARAMLNISAAPSPAAPRDFGGQITRPRAVG